MKRILFVLLLALAISIGGGSQVNAQCSMCSANAEQSVKNGNTQGAGLNNGILYLLAIPYLLITGVGILWYVKYRQKDTQQLS